MVHPAHRVTIPSVAYEGIRSKLTGVLSMSPRQTSTNIRAFRHFLRTMLTSICCLQSASYGYSGMVEQLEVYALAGKLPWEDFADPGNVRPNADGTLTAVQQRDVEAIWTSAQAVYSAQSAIRTACIDALNDAVPEGYKFMPGVIWPYVTSRLSKICWGQSSDQ